MNDQFSKVKHEIKVDEAPGGKPVLTMYDDSLGIPTIGYGRNMQKPISNAVADLMFEEDFAEALGGASSFPWFDQLDEVRQSVVINMVFNLGYPRFSKFQNTIMFLSKGLYQAAGEEILKGSGPNGKSKWYAQVGRRAERLSNMLKTGEWQ